MLEPRGKGISLDPPLGDEVRDAEEYFSDIDNSKPIQRSS